MTSSSIPFVIICAFIASIGLLFNGYILFILFWQKRLKNVYNLLLLHLAIVDTIFCVNIFFGNMFLGLTMNDHFDHFSANSFQGSQNFYFLISQVLGFFWTLFPIILVWTLFGLTWDKFIAISYPLRYSSLINPKKAFHFIVTIWLVAIIICLPPLLGKCSYIYNIPLSATTIFCNNSAYKKWSTLVYIIIYLLFSITIPLTAIIVCNFHILLIAQDHRSRITSSLIEIIQSSSLSLPSNKDFINCQKSRNAFLPISQLIGSLFLFTVPYYINFFIKSFDVSFPLPSFLVSMSTLCLCFMPSANAYIYGVQNKTLRKTLKGLILRYLYKQNVSQEIDRRLSIRSHGSFINLNFYPRRHTYPIFASASQHKLDGEFSEVLCHHSNHEKYLRRQSLCASDDEFLSFSIPKNNIDKARISPIRSLTSDFFSKLSPIKEHLIS